jgi:5-(carboxyamino)imidazole ribonucleotide mutase
MKVAVVMGSKSDLPTLLPAFQTLKSFGVEIVARVLSAHRTPDAAALFASNAKGEGIEVMIAAAGKAAHLAGVLAGHTTLPVIGLPVKSSMMDGLDSLLSTVQMPEGVPVATVAVGGAKNAALLAIQILALKYTELQKELEDYKEEMKSSVLRADAELKWEEQL